MKSLPPYPLHNDWCSGGGGGIVVFLVGIYYFNEHWINEYHTIAEQRKSELNPDLFYAKSHSISIASGKKKYTHRKSIDYFYLWVGLV